MPDKKRRKSVYTYDIALLDETSNTNLCLDRNDCLVEDPRMTISTKAVADKGLPFLGCPRTFLNLLNESAYDNSKMPTNEIQVDGYLAPGEKKDKDGTLTVLGCGAYVFGRRHSQSLELTTPLLSRYPRYRHTLRHSVVAI